MQENQRLDIINSEVTLDHHSLAVTTHNRAIQREMQLRQEKGKPKELEESILQDWQNTFKYWYDVIIDDQYWASIEKRAEELGKNDPRLKVNDIKEIRANLPIALLGINAKLAAEDVRIGCLARAAQHLRLGICAGFPLSTVEKAFDPLFDPIKDEIKEVFKDAKEKLNKKDANASNARAIYEDVCNRVQPLLEKMSMVDPSNLFSEESIKDEYSNIIRSAAITYTNVTNDAFTGCMMLQKSLEVASSALNRNRIEGDLKEARKLITQGFDVPEDYDPSLCWYCGNQKANANAAKTVKIHKVLGRQPFGWNQIRINYRNIDLKIPRCSSCNDQHKMIGSSIGLGLLTYFIFAIIGSFLAGWWLLIVAIFFPLSWIMAWVSYRIIRYARITNYCSEHKVKPAKKDDKFRECPLYKTAIRDGYKDGIFTRK